MNKSILILINEWKYISVPPESKAAPDIWKILDKNRLILGSLGGAGKLAS